MGAERMRQRIINLSNGSRASGFQGGETHCFSCLVRLPALLDQRDGVPFGVASLPSFLRMSVRGT